MTTRVVSWSGGPDSTYGLMQFLRDTDDPVVAVCVGTGTDPKYVRAFMRATRWLEGPLRDRFRDFRVIRYSTSAENGVAEPSDEVTVLSLVTALAFSDPVLYWFHCADDSAETGWPTRNEALVQRQTTLMESVITEENLNEDLGKDVICQELGDLWDLTWSCLYPTSTLEPCRECEKCQERRRAEALAQLREDPVAKPGP